MFHRIGQERIVRPVDGAQRSTDALDLWTFRPSGAPDRGAGVIPAGSIPFSSGQVHEMENVWASREFHGFRCEPHSAKARPWTR